MPMNRYEIGPFIWLMSCVYIRNSSDNSIEGIKLKSKPVFSVQYHPESNPGPQDSVYLFQEFINSMKKNAKKKRH